MSRPDDIQRFYGAMARLEARLGGARRLATCNGRHGWPSHGVYFFFEEGERRAAGSALRVVRVGTHALTATSRTTLWDRLSAHRGNATGSGGNHRGSIFRLLLGEAFLLRSGIHHPSWGVGQSVGQAAARLRVPRDVIKAQEASVEAQVSRLVGDMRILWIASKPEAREERAEIEAGTIGLLANVDREAIDGPSPGWLGRYSGRERVRTSGLWNNDHVDRKHESGFLDLLDAAVARTPALPA